MTFELTASPHQIAVQQDLAQLLSERAKGGVVDLKITKGFSAGTIAKDTAWIIGNVLRLREEGKFKTDVISA